MLLSISCQDALCFCMYDTYRLLSQLPENQDHQDKNTAIFLFMAKFSDRDKKAYLPTSNFNPPIK